MDKIKSIIFATALLFSTSSWALPSTDDGLSIGGLIVNDLTGEPLYNLDENYQVDYVGQIEPGLFITCPTEFLLQTGTDTNSFFHNVEFSCPSLDGVGGIYGLFGGISTTLTGGFSGNETVEIIRLSRSLPNAPTSILFEPFGVPNSGFIEVLPSVLDQDGNTVYVGSSVTATTDGSLGPVGSPAYNIVIDGIPDDVVAANINRVLRLELLTDFTVESVEIPLTYSSLGCIELLHIGPAETVPTPRTASFGCLSQLPPGNCLDKTTDAIAAARAYKKSTRKVKRECGRKMSADCSYVLQLQAQAYSSLEQAQEGVIEYCGNY